MINNNNNNNTCTMYELGEFINLFSCCIKIIWN